MTPEPAPELAEDIASRERALDPAGSFIVQAPAGSGKTELLIQRILVLLARVNAPEEILAITFTRKAAAEMRARLVRALEESDGPEPPEEHARLTWRLARAAMARDRDQGWALTQHPARLRLQTVDSFCANLVRRMPWLSQLGQAPEPVDNAMPLYREAARAVFRRVLEPDADQDPVLEPLSRLMLHRGNNIASLSDLLCAMYARRDQWLRHVVRGALAPDELRAGLEEALGMAVEAGLRELDELLPRQQRAAILAAARYAAGNLDDGTYAALGEASGWRDFPRPTAAHLDAWWDVIHLLTVQGAKGFRGAVDKRHGFPTDCSEGKAVAKARKEEFKALVARLAATPGLLEALQRTARLPSPCFSDRQWSVLQALFQVLPVAVAELHLVFQAHGQADFIEYSQGALRALGDPDAPTDLALSLDHRIQHILMDEFQDTSWTQFQLLGRLLAGWEPGDGRTLFLVGDPMQSIYRFREADVGLFLKAWAQGVDPVALEPLRLRRNFRSRAGVVDWINDVFAQVLPPRPDRLTGAVPYSMSYAARDGAKGAAGNGADSAAVRIHPFVGEARDEAAEAARVVALVRDALDRSATESVAILVKARSHLPAIVNALGESGIAFQATDIDPLADRRVVRDLLSITRALRHPADRIAWFALLRAPWCGLSLADLQRVADHRGTSVLASVGSEDLLADLSADGQARMARVGPLLAHAVSQRQRGRLSERVEDLWLRLGGPACIQAPERREAEAFINLLDRMEQAGELADLAAFEARLAELFAPADPGGRVHLLTLHKAKGLEFDTVILPGLDRKPPNDRPALMQWQEQDEGPAGLILAPIRGDDEPEPDAINAYLGSVQARARAMEDGRLLYVACTRARDRLHLLGHATIRFDKEGEPTLRAPDSRSMLARLWTDVEAHFAAALDEFDPDPEAKSDAEVEVPPLRRLSVDWRLPDPPAPPLSREHSREDTERGGDVEGPDFDWASPMARHVGSVVHRYLQAVAEQGLERWDDVVIKGARPGFRAMLLTLGVAERDLDRACERVTRALEQTLSCERGRWILGPHDDAACELPLSLIEEGRVIAGVVDRTFVEDGVRWVVDYKTGEHRGSDREAFLDNEMDRYADQLRLYERMFLALGEQQVRLALYFPLMGAWRELTGRA
ncbi:MAG: UvrD-helicase domain-containing protein [Gammaproteobacteria bacterium]